MDFQPELGQFLLSAAFWLTVLILVLFFTAVFFASDDWGELKDME